VRKRPAPRPKSTKARRAYSRAPIIGERVPEGVGRIRTLLELLERAAPIAAGRSCVVVLRNSEGEEFGALALDAELRASLLDALGALLADTDPRKAFGLDERGRAPPGGEEKARRFTVALRVALERRRGATLEEACARVAERAGMEERGVATVARYAKAMRAEAARTIDALAATPDGAAALRALESGTGEAIFYGAEGRGNNSG
jgi:hypothetical protein